MLPEEIIAIRKRYNMSCVKFAHLVGVSSQSIYEWEKGIVKPCQRSINKLSVLDVKLAFDEIVKKAFAPHAKSSERTL